MSNTVDKVIKIATQEVGYLEKKSNSNLDSKTANAGYNNYTKYGRDMHNIYPQIMDFPAPWCDAFVDWCFYKAYGVTTAKSLLCGNFDDYTVASAQMYKNKKSYYKSNPIVGDQIFFKNSKGGICHTGLVYYVDSKYVYTIEGNTSGASGVIANGGGVFKKKYDLSYSRIQGYGRPKYDIVANNENTNVYTVVKGDTLSIIGQKVGMNWRTIADINGIKSPYIITIGQKLKIYDVYTTPTYAESNTNQSIPITTYSKTQFIKDVQKAIGAKVDGIAGKETLSKTVTVSKTKNMKHAVVKPIQKYFNYLGYNCGVVDGIAGTKFDAAVKSYQKANGCAVDGEITAKKTTWKKLLGI